MLNHTILLAHAPDVAVSVAIPAWVCRTVNAPNRLCRLRWNARICWIVTLGVSMVPSGIQLGRMSTGMPTHLPSTCATHVPRSASTAAASSVDSVINSLRACASVSTIASSGIVGRDAAGEPAAEAVGEDVVGAAVVGGAVVAAVAERPASGGLGSLPLRPRNIPAATPPPTRRTVRVAATAMMPMLPRDLPGGGGLESDVHGAAGPYGGGGVYAGIGECDGTVAASSDGTVGASPGRVGPSP